MRVSDSDKKRFIELPPEKWDYTFICSLIVDNYSYKEKKIKKSKYKCNDTMILEANEYFNKERVETTLGSFIFNKVVIELSKTQHVLGYVNEEITNGVYKKMTSKLSSELLAGKIQRDDMALFLNIFENFGMRMHSALAGSFTPNTFKPIPAVLKKRDELFKKYEKELSTEDTNAAVKMVEIEKELVSMAKNILKNDPGMMLYNTKANASFDNNYKNIFITRGAAYDPGTGKTHIIKNCLAEGIEKESIPVFGTDMVVGAYSKACDTAISGYQSKSTLAFMQSTVMDKDLFDCGSKGTMPILIEDPNDYLYKYIIEDGKLIQLTESVIKNYVGKTVNMRSICFCTSQKLCEVCTGSVPKKLNIETIGLMSTMITGKFSNLSMKKFHDNTIKLSEININDLYLFN